MVHVYLFNNKSLILERMIHLKVYNYIDDI